MIDAFQRATLLALYQLSIVMGIVLMPIALVVRFGGVTLPVHRVVGRLGRAYDSARSSP